MDRLGCQTSIRNLRKALDSLPTKLNETYDEAMNRIQGQVQEHSQLALSALAWISNALRPLKLDELKEALAIQPGDPELDEEAIPEEALIVSVSAGLITIDNESETMRLVHFTVEEYFRGSKQRWFPHAHTQIAETCLTYLSFDEFESGACSSDEEYKTRLKRNCLLEYASRNWGLHASRAENTIGDVALSFLLDERKVSCASQILIKEDVWPYGSVANIPKQFTGLHLTAYFNATDLAKKYLDLEESESLVNPKDSNGWTPLSWAAKRGNIAVVKVLLDRDHVVADSQDSTGRTPLSKAAEGGHTAVVKLLLDRDDVVADSQDSGGQTPLSYATDAKYGEEVVKLLLDRDDVAADHQDEDGRTPLSWAVEAKYGEEVVKLLLARNDVVADSQDKTGRTPLSWAAEAWYGEWQVEPIKLLLEREDVVADSKDEYGCTPLIHAIKNRRRGMIMLLLDRDDVAADCQDARGRTPLDHAIECGDNGIVWLLKKKLGDEDASESSGSE